VVILHMAAVTAMDATALNRIENLYEKLHRHHKYLVLSGAHTQPYSMLERAGFFDVIGHENITNDLEAAVTQARKLTAQK
jgi:SulP family sulfate permease